jgi:hypothetical protein
MALPITRPGANLRRGAHAVQMAAGDVSEKAVLTISRDLGSGDHELAAPFGNLGHAPPSSAASAVA